MNENLIKKAKNYGARMHAGQTRKSDGAPMFTHPIRVAETLLASGLEEHVVIAGYLHDTVEDTDATLEEIQELFGKDVAEVVAGNTENKEHTWEQRKQHTIDWIAEAPMEVRALIVADKLDNLRSMKKAYEKDGEKLFVQFKRGKEKQLWYFKSVSENMYQPHIRIEGASFPEFFKIYEDLVVEFESLIMPDSR